MYLVKITNGLRTFEVKQKSFVRAKRLAYWYKMQGFHVQISEVKK